jgi:hypothetical protein
LRLDGGLLDFYPVEEGHGITAMHASGMGAQVGFQCADRTFGLCFVPVLAVLIKCNSCTALVPWIAMRAPPCGQRYRGGEGNNDCCPPYCCRVRPGLPAAGLRYGVVVRGFRPFLGGGR